MNSPIASGIRRKRSGKRTFRWKVWALVAFILVALLVVWWAFPNIKKEEIVAYGKGLPGAIFIGLLVILPLVGVPISILLVITGLKYGTLVGMALTTLATGAHNLIAFTATKSWFQSRIEGLLSRLGYSIPTIPERHQWWFTAVFATVPGLPYASKLYSLALTNIPFRIYFWIGWPTYAVNCIVYVALGDAAARLESGWFVAAAAIGVVILYVTRRMIKKYGGPVVESGD